MTTIVRPSWGLRGSGSTEHGAALIVAAGSEIRALFAVQSGVGLGREDLGPGREFHRGGDLIDGELPCVAGHVPVQFVVLLEKAELPVGAVGQRIGIFTGFEDDILAAHIHPHAVALVLCPPRFGLAVFQDGLDLEGDLHRVAIFVLVAGGKIAVDAVLDPVALTDNLDGLGHGHIPGRLDLYERVIAEDALSSLGQRRAGGREQGG